MASSDQISFINFAIWISHNIHSSFRIFHTRPQSSNDLLIFKIIRSFESRSFLDRSLLWSWSVVPVVVPVIVLHLSLNVRQSSFRNKLVGYLWRIIIVVVKWHLRISWVQIIVWIIIIVLHVSRIPACPERSREVRDVVYSCVSCKAERHKN